MKRLIVCETVAAITTHLRELADDEEPNYHGHRTPAPKTLCGVGMGWDTRLPIESARCLGCLVARDIIVQAEAKGGR